MFGVFRVVGVGFGFLVFGFLDDLELKLNRLLDTMNHEP